MKDKCQELLDDFEAIDEDDLQKKLWETALTLECRGCEKENCICYIVEGDPFYPICNKPIKS